MKKITYILLLNYLLIVLSGCGKSKETDSLIIAEQYGLAYAPLQIMKEKGILEELLPETKIEWVTLPNTTAIREAMLSDKLDIGFVGIPPFLIALDNGMDWKIICGLSKNPSGLVTYDENIKGLSDFTEADKIALPQPGSIQHILLAMACEREFKNAKELDHLLVTMNHPDAFLSLKNKSTIKAHFTSPPYLFDELKDEGNHLVLSGKEAFGGDFTFIVGVCREKLYSNVNQYEALTKGLEKAMNFMIDEKEETNNILSKNYNIDKNIIGEYLNEEGMEYTNKVEGVEKFVSFMYENDFLKNNYLIKELIWE